VVGSDLEAAVASSRAAKAALAAVMASSSATVMPMSPVSCWFEASAAASAWSAGEAGVSASVAEPDPQGSRKPVRCSVEAIVVAVLVLVKKPCSAVW
jgi:hypothetical protein